MAKNIAASRQKKPGGLSDKVSDIVLVVICAAVMLIVASAVLCPRGILLRPL